MANVAIAGVGIMGRGMAENLLRHGHHVTLWNRTPERIRDLAASGAQIAATPAEAAAGAEVVFEVTADDTSSRQVWLADDGILAGATPDAVLITSATLSVDWVEELGAAATTNGSVFYDMPLTGGAAGARTGNLVLLVGGDPTALPTLDPVLQAISREVRHFGPISAGTRFKLVLNALQAAHMAAFGEALHLAATAGLDPATVGPALVARPGGTITELAWSNHIDPPHPVNFSARWAHKDLDYATRMSATGEHPILDSVLEKFTAVLESGRGDADWSVVNEG